MKSAIEINIIDNLEQIGVLVDRIVLHHAKPILSSPSIYIDLEGVNLCREGSLSILTLLIDEDLPEKRVYLIDVYTLGMQAFSTTGVQQKTLKDILQNEKISKVFYDVRNDSDTLFAHFGIALRGVQDVQLMESATRKTTASRKFLNGLSKCIESNALTSLSGNNLATWKLAKKKGERLFKPEHGGSAHVFNQRPIPKEIISHMILHCCQHWIIPLSYHHK